MWSFFFSPATLQMPTQVYTERVVSTSMFGRGSGRHLCLGSAVLIMAFILIWFKCLHDVCNKVNSSISVEDVEDVKSL